MLAEARALSAECISVLKNLSALSAECFGISVFHRALESARCTVCGVGREARLRAAVSDEDVN